MSFYDSNTFREDLKQAVLQTVSKEKLFHASVMITGASGLIGSFMTDMLLELNRTADADITVYAIDLSEERMAARFAEVKTEKLIFVEHNVNDLPDFDFSVDYIIHAASNAFPAAFNSDPVGTIMSNIQGTKYLLDYGRDHGAKRLLYISSGEVYGQGDLSLESFAESYGGYVDPTEPRSCYPNSKRCAETLCVSYTKQFGLETVIVRPSHTFGANATKADNRANVQFINQAMAGEDIVLTSAGSQMRSYTYIADSASAIISVLTAGESGQAYNIANPASRTTVAGLAQTIADETGVKLVFADPDAVQKAELSPIAKQVLCADKLEALGWKGSFTVADGVQHVLRILNELK